MTISEILDRIYKKAAELGIDLESMGMYDDEDVQIKALILFLNNLEDVEDEILEVEQEDYDEFVEEF